MEIRLWNIGEQQRDVWRGVARWGALRSAELCQVLPTACTPWIHTHRCVWGVCKELGRADRTGTGTGTGSGSGSGSGSVFSPIHWTDTLDLVRQPDGELLPIPDPLHTADTHSSMCIARVQGVGRS